MSAPPRTDEEEVIFMSNETVFAPPAAAAAGVSVTHSATHCHALVANPLADESDE